MGFLLALGAPAGWLLLRVLGGASPLEELSGHLDLYLYMLLTTAFVLATFGFVLGEREDRLKQLNRRLDLEAGTDSLTGMKNRRFFLERLEEECRRAERGNHSFTLLLFDLDHFKRVNDTLGHPVGDRVLKAFAAILETTMRRSELAARVGGEEFAVLLPNAEVEEGRQAAERLRKAVKKGVAEAAGIPPNWTVTVSAGVTSSSDRQVLHPEALMMAADRALYRAKERGRNRVEVESAAQDPPQDADTIPQ
jgi:diguanylate cyclase (GGDEF)-like protein